MVKLYGTTLFASTEPGPSVRIIISYYSTTRLEREQILGLFELCPNQPNKIPEKFVLNSIWLNLWVYGDTTTKVTDGNMQEYVSKYLTQHSDFPRVLNKFPQRSFHSILLGSKDRKEVRELLKARDFETLTTDYVINKKGVRRPVSMSDAYYSQFAVKFTGSSCFNVAATSSLFRSVVYVARRFFATKGEIYDDGQVREFLMWLLKPTMLYSG